MEKNINQLIKDFVLDSSDEFFFKYTLYSDITCIEMSIPWYLVNDVFEYIEKTPEIELPIGYIWIAYTCETCIETHGKDYVHLAIENKDFVESYFDKDTIIKKSRGYYEICR